MLDRPFARAMRQLKAAGLRPTRQRLALAKLLLDTAPRHVTAEELFQEARAAGIPVSLATVYNTLHQFTGAGIMSEVVVGSGQSYFDTNPTSHYHYFDPTNGQIIDIPPEQVRFLRLPQPPARQGDRAHRRRGPHPQRGPGAAAGGCRACRRGQRFLSLRAAQSESNL